jgi:hypothetical protein
MFTNRLKLSDKAAILLSSIIFSGSVSAIPITTTGGLDNFLASASWAEVNTNSNAGVSEAEEEAWVSSILGSTFAIDYKDEAVGSWELVTGGDADAAGDWYANDLLIDPSHYLLKLGVGGTGAHSYYLFENLAELGYAVVDLSFLSDIFNETDGGSKLTFNLGRVSHISQGGTVSVPEPGSIALLAIGLVGLSRVRRQHK